MFWENVLGFGKLMRDPFGKLCVTLLGHRTNQKHVIYLLSYSFNELILEMLFSHLGVISTCNILYLLSFLYIKFRKQSAKKESTCACLH